MDPEVAEESIDERLDFVESRLTELSEVPNNVSLIGEALMIIRGVLADLVDAAGVDSDEYIDDLGRLDQLAHIIR